MIPTRLQELRKNKELKQIEIAKILGIAQNSYSQYELSKRDIPCDILIKLADLYETSIDYILYRTDKK